MYLDYMKRNNITVLERKYIATIAILIIIK
jgi:hypothetical protein